MKNRNKKKKGWILFCIFIIVILGIFFINWAMKPENLREAKEQIRTFFFKNKEQDSYNANRLF